mgnify:FL=1
METLNYKVLESTGYNGYILKDAPVKVMQFGDCLLYTSPSPRDA